MSDKHDVGGQVLSSIRRIIRAIDLNSKKLVRKYGLTGPQLVVLKELEYHNELTVGEIASNVSLSSATVTNILDRLEKRGLVRRTRCTEDKRQVLVKPTDAAHRILQNAPPFIQELLFDKFESLEDWEQNLILSSLQRIVSMMEAEKVDAASVLATGPLTAEPEETEKFLSNDSKSGINTAKEEEGI